MNELNKKLLEFAGWEFIEEGQYYRVYSFTSGWSSTRHCPNFPESLDACFKYLVPELLLDRRVTITTWNGNKLWYAQLSRPHKFFCVAEAKTLALAICKAIEKVI